MTNKKGKKKKRKENYLVIIDAMRQGLQKIFSQVYKNLVNLFESLPPVLANSTENNTNKLYRNYFIKWQNGKSGQFNSQKLMVRQRKRFMLFYTC